jgi:hypothetical protein
VVARWLTEGLCDLTRHALAERGVLKRADNRLRLYRKLALIERFIIRLRLNICRRVRRCRCRCRWLYRYRRLCLCRCLSLDPISISPDSIAWRMRIALLNCLVELGRLI